jgi:tight adherence protein C
MLIIGMACVAIAIMLMAYLLVGRVEPAAAAAPATAPTAEPAGGPVSQSLPPLYERLARLADRLTPARYGERLRHRLDLAGNPRGLPAERILAYKGLGLIIGVLLGAVAGARHGMLLVVFAAVFGVVGFLLPDFWVRIRGERRHAQLVRGLPDAIDMMTVCVEAGLGFDAALGRVGRTLTGPVAEEFARVLQETQFGLSRADALRALSARTDVTELRSFCRAIVQAAELGISVGDVLREQARVMRIKRRQRAEERAQKLPVKLLMPLLLCLLPSMFVVVLGPAVLNIIHTITSGGFL